MKITEKIRSELTYFDGGTGSLLISRGLDAGENSALWNISRPDDIKEIHTQYVNAGADVITSNTFGANPFKTDNYAECIAKGLEIARSVANSCRDRKIYVGFDIGPSGRLLKPFGDFEFEEAVSFFKKIISCADDKADFILFETFSDCLETKAAVIAAKECSALPIFVSNTYDESSRLLTGTNPEAMAAMLESLSVSAVGANCSVGPKQMLKTVQRLCRSTSLPVFVNPNAGFPRELNGQTVYDVDEESFSDAMCEFVSMGVNAVGGCCGTTPEYIKATLRKIGRPVPVIRAVKPKTVISSWAKAVEIGKKPIIIGERINPTGKPKLKEALKSGDYEYLLNEALSQTEAGAHILDVNVGLPVIDEKTVMQEVITRIQAICELPLQIDTVDANALENGLRVYSGKPLINSVNGKKESLETVLPLAAKYGGAVIALTLDENGIPSSARERADIARKIVDKALEYGLKTCDIIVDPLALAVSSDINSASVTLESIELIKKELGVCVSLGVSNISFGLPVRDLVNGTFFAMALERGLDLAIINPLSFEMMKVYNSYLALKGYDEACADYISFASGIDLTAPKLTNSPVSLQSVQEGSDLHTAIEKGTIKTAVELCSKMLEEDTNPLDIINTEIIPALEYVGKEFEAQRLFLPQLLMSAECAKEAFECLKAKMPIKSEEGNDKIVLATVKGDLHDIGKNIVKTVLQSYGFDVIDLGKDVSPETILDAVKVNNVKLVGLSALMTTTVPAMKETIDLLKANVADIYVMVGGAVLNEECADMIGADAYANDAMASVRIAKNFFT